MTTIYFLQRKLKAKLTAAREKAVEEMEQDENFETRTKILYKYLKQQLDAISDYYETTLRKK